MAAFRKPLPRVGNGTYRIQGDAILPWAPTDTTIDPRTRVDSEQPKPDFYREDGGLHVVDVSMPSFSTLFRPTDGSGVTPSTETVASHPDLPPVDKNKGPQFDGLEKLMRMRISSGSLELRRTVHLREPLSLEALGELCRDSVDTRRHRQAYIMQASGASRWYPECVRCSSGLGPFKACIAPHRYTSLSNLDTCNNCYHDGVRCRFELDP